MVKSKTGSLVTEHAFTDSILAMVVTAAVICCCLTVSQAQNLSVCVPTLSVSRYRFNNE